MNNEETEILQALAAIKELCRKAHKGPGGAAMCVCGASGGGSPACRFLSILRQHVRYGDPQKLTSMLYKVL